MKKVFLVSHSQKIGGAERCLYELADGLVKAGFEVVVSTPSRGENFNLFNSLNIWIIIVSYPWWVHINSGHLNDISRIRKAFSQVKAIIKLIKIIALIKPDYIISNTAVMPAAAIASKFLGKKHFWFIHELTEEDHGLKFDYGWKFSTKIVSLTARKIFINSQFVKSKFEQYISGHKFQIVNIDVPTPAISFDEKVSTEKGTINLYLIGQIQPGKGQIIAIKAHQILQGNGLKSKLFIIGSISNKEYFEFISAYIFEQSVKEVYISPFTTNPFENIAKNSIGLMCSEFEAFGRVTIEFMKVGIPVIGCNAGETKNIIKHEWNGLLFEKNDEFDLTKKILHLHENQFLKNRIVSNARQYADERFNSKNFLTQIIRVLDANDE